VVKCSSYEAPQYGCSLLHPLATSSLLGPNILHSTLFSNNLNVCVRDKDSHPYKTKGKIVVLYTSVFKLLERRKGRHETLNRMVASNPHI
jgi:hypothetical protein